MPRPSLQHVFHPDNAAHYAQQIRSGLRHLLGHLDRVDGPARGRTPEQAAARVAGVDLDTPLADTDAALAEISELWLDDAIWFHEPSYAAHLNCPVVTPALLAELFIASVNSSVDTFDQSVGATFIERRLVEWTARRIGFGADADDPDHRRGGPVEHPDGIFTSGGTQSNLQALLLARGRMGQVPPGSLRILASADAHFSVQKAARLLGLGDEAVISVPVDARHRMDPAALARSLAACVDLGLQPMAIAATAGTTDFGAIDPLPELADLARAYDTWLHVDAAYGGGLLVSPTRRHLLDGIERADSVTVDYHKTFFQPVSSSALIVRDAALLAPVTWHADYLNPREADSPNQVDKSLQTTRRFDALKLWLTLRTMGPDLVGEYVDTVIDLAADVYERTVDTPDIEIVAPPSLSTLVFRYLPEPGAADETVAAASPGYDEARLDRLNTAVRGALYASGQAMVAATKVDGRTYLKLTLLNPMASTEDILGVLDLVRGHGRRIAADLPALEVAR